MPPAGAARLPRSRGGRGSAAGARCQNSAKSVLHRRGVLPVFLNLSREPSPVYLIRQIFLEGSAALGEMVVREVIVVVDQLPFVRVLL